VLREPSTATGLRFYRNRHRNRQDVVYFVLVYSRSS